MSTTIETGDQLAHFDGSEYQLPIPEKDGHRADILRVAIGGQIDLDLMDEQALQFLNGLKLGQELDLTLTVRVSSSGWRHTLKGEDETDHVVHQVALKADSLQIPDA